LLVAALAPRHVSRELVRCGNPGAVHVLGDVIRGGMAFCCVHRLQGWLQAVAFAAAKA